MGSWFYKNLCQEYEVAAFDKDQNKLKNLKNRIKLQELSDLKKFNLHAFEIPFGQHDKLMPHSLALPFASSIAGIAGLEKIRIIPDTTFKKHKEIARGLFKEDNRLLSEMLFNSYSILQIEKICANLEYLKHMIKDKDYEVCDKFFNNLKSKF